MLCFAYAGGGSSAFAGWAHDLPQDVEVCAVRLPGRESRILQQPYADLQELLPDLGDAAAPYCAEPFVLFGHSMGALIAFEYARWLRDTGRPDPRHLFVSGRRAPQLPHNRPLVHDLPAEDFVKQLWELGGTPKELLTDPRVMRMVTPGLRADFQLNDTYRYRRGPVLGCPISAFGGRTDPHVDQAGLTAWAHQSQSSFALHMMDGGHFFLHSARDALLRKLAGTLWQTMATGGETIVR
jgi:surfactin synthase thioesterase subunit